MIELPTTPVPDNALLADIGDGEFRTYAFICHLAWRTHPHAEQPYTDLDYEQLAHFHPGNVPLTVSGIRARINRLVKAGLLRRERINNICWRTYPTLDTPAKNETVGVIPDNTHPRRADNWVLCPITPNHECKALGVTAHSTHQPQTTNWVLSDVAPSDHSQVMGNTVDNTQLDSNAVGAMPDHTQMAPAATWVLPHMTSSDGTKALGATSDHTQRPEHRLGVMPHHSQTSTGMLAATPDHTQAIDLIDLDLCEHHQPEQAFNQIKTADNGHAGSGTEATQQATLSEALANLAPQAMSPAGIRECLTQPALTAAWLAYVLDPANGVQKPAAYLRKQVRRGTYPPQTRTVQSDNGAVERSDYAATLPANPHPTVFPTSGQSAPVAVAQSRATRWPLDTG